MIFSSQHSRSATPDWLIQSALSSVSQPSITSSSFNQLAIIWCDPNYHPSLSGSVATDICLSYYCPVYSLSHLCVCISSHHVIACQYCPSVCCLWTANQRLRIENMRKGQCNCCCLVNVSPSGSIRSLPGPSFKWHTCHSVAIGFLFFVCAQWKQHFTGMQTQTCIPENFQRA